jgi:hypothetical protein
VSYELFRKQYVTCFDHVKALNDLHMPPIFRKHVEELRRTWTLSEMRVALRSFQGNPNRVKLLEAAIAASALVPEGSSADLAARALSKIVKRLQGD